MSYAIVKENNNQYTFSKFHETLEEAEQEAERLCRKERTTFYILELKKKCYIEETPVKWVNF